MKQQFLVDTEGTFQTYIYENNRKVIAASASITVYKPGGDTKLIDAQAMTVGGDGLLSYSLSAAHNDLSDENYKAVLAYIYNSVTYYVTLFYDVVNSLLIQVITDEDLVSELPRLKEAGWRVHGSADSGSTTTIVDAELSRYGDDYFTGGLAHSIDRDEFRQITDFVSSTGTVTTTAFTGAISTDKYILTRSFSREIQRAFEKIEDRIIRHGRRPHLILDPYDLREVHIYFSIAEVSRGMSREVEDFWWVMWKEYENKAESAFLGINFKYDSSMDGFLSGSEENSRVNVLRTFRR